MVKKILSTAALAACTLGCVSAHAAYIKLADVPAANYSINEFFAGNSGGDPFSFSNDGSHWTTQSINASSLTSNTPNITLYNDLSNVFTDLKLFFVAGGVLAAELDFNYLGDFSGHTGVQKITYNNYLSQGLALAAPASGGVDLAAVDFGATAYRWYGNWNSNTPGIAFYNDGMTANKADVAAAAERLNGNSVPEPGSLALVCLAIGALATRKRRCQA